jgi:hypothetical protein
VALQQMEAGYAADAYARLQGIGRAIYPNVPLDRLLIALVAEAAHRAIHPAVTPSTRTTPTSIRASISRSVRPISLKIS